MCGYYTSNPNYNTPTTLTRMNKEMAALNYSSLSLLPTHPSVKETKTKNFRNLGLQRRSIRSKNGISCKISGEGNEERVSSNSTITKPNKNDRMEEYNTAMKRLMRSPSEYHHDLGSQPQKPEDIEHLKKNENVAYILNLQQDKDMEYWGIEFSSILEQCQNVRIRHMRRPAKDFDPDSLREMLPRAVSSLEWAVSEGKGRVYVHCTAGLGRAPAVAIAYMFWFCGWNLNKAYDELTSK